MEKMHKAEFTQTKFEWTSLRKVGKFTLHQLVVGELAQPIFHCCCLKIKRRGCRSKDLWLHSRSVFWASEVPEQI